MTAAERSRRYREAHREEINARVRLRRREQNERIAAKRAEILAKKARQR